MGRIAPQVVVYTEYENEICMLHYSNSKSYLITGKVTFLFIYSLLSKQLI